MKNIVYIIFLGLCLSACAGKDGEIGPAGDPGKPGAVGPAGDKGPTGDKGATGPAGANSSSTGIENLVLTSWKKATWKFNGSENNEKYYLGEVAFPELTQAVIDKGFFRVFYRLNNNVDEFGKNEFPFTLISTISSSSISMKQTVKGIKVGKLVIQSTVSNGNSNETDLTSLNALPLDYRINIIK
jgi:hypothetical protein